MTLTERSLSRTSFAPTLDTMKDWDEVLAWMDASPEDAGAWHHLGAICVEFRCYEEAADAYRRALRIDTKDAGAWNNLGFAYLLSANRQAAQNVHRELRRLDPERADTLFCRIVRC